MSGWDKNLAYIWTNNVSPSRPSNSELCIYTKHLRKLQLKKRQKIKMLVLGSTPEFRDWGFEQNLDICVVDKSREYYNCISREIRHKNLKETVFFQSWEKMQLNRQFDLIIGDLAIGNVNPNCFDIFLRNIKSALSDDGLFLGKSFIWSEEERIKTPLEIIKDFQLHRYLHPYTYINHQLALYCLDRDDYTLDFSVMFNELKKLYDSGNIDNNIFSFFTDIGWNSEMKFKFFSPSQKVFINYVNKELKFIGFEHSEDCYTNVFPIYVITKGDY